MSIPFDSLEGHARYLDRAVLFVDSHETWKVGDFGQSVSSYQTITYDGVVLSDAIGFVALAVDKTDTGYTLYAVSSDGNRVFAAATMDSTGWVTAVQQLSELDLLAVENTLGTDLNGNGGIGAGQVLITDSQGLDVVADHDGTLALVDDFGKVVPLYLGGAPITLDMLGDALDITDVVATTNGYQAYVSEEATGAVYKLGFSLEGRSAVVALLTPEEVRAEEAARSVDLNNRTDTALTEGWTGLLQVAAVREQVEQLTQGGRKLGYGDVLQIVAAAINSVPPGEKVGEALVSDLRAIAARGDALFGEDAATTDYLSFVFDKMVSTSKANNFYTGGTTKSNPLGSLHADSSLDQLQKLAGKWLLGTDLPNPTSVGDSANPQATAATGVYKAFDASLFGDGPQFSDVNQGSAGTCYLMAAAAAVAHSNPGAIEALFVTNGPVNGDLQTYGVRLYDARGEAHWVTVSNHLAVGDLADTVPLYSKLSSNTAPENTKLWMPLLEKAYAQMNEQDFLGRPLAHAGKNAVWAIEGGMGEAGSLILGTGAWTYDAQVQEPELFNNNPWLTVQPLPEGSGQLDALTQYMNGGNTLWLASMLDTTDAAGVRQFVAGHAFIAMDADPNDPANTTVSVYNPWGAPVPGAPYAAPFEADLAALVGVEELSFWMYAY